MTFTLEIVEFAGGQWLGSMPNKPSSDVFVISCAKDKKVLTSAKKNGVTVCDNEVILTGLLRKELDTKAHLLKL